MNSYLTRIRLRRELPIGSLMQLLNPRNESERFAIAHKLIWTLFADRPDRQRDFLWREGRPGTYYLLSQRLPRDEHRIFEIDEPKLFAPVLREGDRLGFVLRANATVAKSLEKGQRGKPCDVVMNALQSIPPGGRASSREGAVQNAGRAWLMKQGERKGFVIEVVGESAGEGPAISHKTLSIPRRSKPARIGVIDFEGTLQVADPAKLLDAINHGIGRAKAFGCGLMLIRRL